MTGKHVRIGSRDFVTVSPMTSVVRAEELMDNYSVDQALVLEGDELVGTVTYDAVSRARKRANREGMEADEVLTEDLMMEVEELNEEMREAIAKGLRDAEREF